MRYLIAVSTCVIGLCLAGSAGAGGWAAVGFEPLPDGTTAGTTWRPTIFVKQHGVTPLGGLHPIVTIEDSKSGEIRTFAARSGSEAGAYRADVVFPAAGAWRVTIYSGFGDSQVTYGPVTIGPESSGTGSNPIPVVGAAALLGTLVVGAAALLALRRRSRLTPASG